ncbi:hypothetical protein QJS10_CPB13g01288 [Acorus calamus]|uniref:Uncharacterized protein n=1 Tax=Acorus calamus TaxID=4465 RepID=A0AAV9DHB2_ACOCL|nr:hypothetical protein QJS10_CPB13g01288 [Acorus calamus]
MLKRYGHEFWIKEVSVLSVQSGVSILHSISLSMLNNFHLRKIDDWWMPFSDNQKSLYPNLFWLTQCVPFRDGVIFFFN